MLYDASHDARFANQLLHAISSGLVALRHGRIEWRSDALPPVDPAALSRDFQADGAVATVPHPLELKLFRRVEPGTHPEIEITEHLYAAGFTHLPGIVGAIDYASNEETNPRSIAMFARPRLSVEGQTDGWTHTLEWLHRFFDQVAARDLPQPPEAFTTDRNSPAAISVIGLMTDYLDLVARLGRRTGDFHRVLSAPTADTSWAPEPFGGTDLTVASKAAGARAQQILAKLATALDRPAARIPADAAERARGLLDSRARLIEILATVADTTVSSTKIRVHGDYRLGQIVISEGDLSMQNVEGHPAWPASAQREKQSPLRDVASMLRSFSYAAHAALQARSALRPDEIPRLTRWVGAWTALTSASFLDTYSAVIADSPSLAMAPADRDRLLTFFMVDRGMRELDGELTNRPEWIGIPLSGLLELLNA
jgi:maltose alpha-D-glucosyltransferase/alpha-amylase